MNRRHLARLALLALIGLICLTAIGCAPSEIIVSPTPVRVTLKPTPSRTVVVIPTPTRPAPTATATSISTSTPTATLIPTHTPTFTPSPTNTPTLSPTPIPMISIEKTAGGDFFVLYRGVRLVQKHSTEFFNFRWPRSDPGDECMYVHYLVGYLEDGIPDNWKCEGDERPTALQMLKQQGKYVEWENSTRDSTLRFQSQSHVKLTVVDNKTVVGNITVTLVPVQDIPHVVNLYVELGRKSGGFDWTAEKSRAGVQRKDMVTLPKADQYIGHYYRDTLSSSGDWIMGRADGASFAFVFNWAKETQPDGAVTEITTVNSVALDSGGYDTIELHQLGHGYRAEWDRQATLGKGTEYQMNYYVLVAAADGYDWIEKLIPKLSSIF